MAAAAASSPAAYCGMGGRRPQYCFGMTKRPGLRVSVVSCRSSSSDDETDWAMATQAEGETSKAPVMEVPKGPSSLISTLNVEKALRGIAITDVDHYSRLGLQPGCSYDEVSVGYKKKVAEVSNKGLSQEELRKEVDLLKVGIGVDTVISGGKESV